MYKKVKKKLGRQIFFKFFNIFLEFVLFVHILSHTKIIVYQLSTRFSFAYHVLFFYFLLFYLYLILFHMIKIIFKLSTRFSFVYHVFFLLIYFIYILYYIIFKVVYQFSTRYSFVYNFFFYFLLFYIYLIVKYAVHKSLIINGIKFFIVLRLNKTDRYYYTGWIVQYERVQYSSENKPVEGRPGTKGQMNSK